MAHFPAPTLCRPIVVAVCLVSVGIAHAAGPLKGGHPSVADFASIQESIDKNPTC